MAGSGSGRLRCGSPISRVPGSPQVRRRSAVAAGQPARQELRHNRRSPGSGRLEARPPHGLCSGPRPHRRGRSWRQHPRGDDSRGRKRPVLPCCRAAQTADDQRRRDEGSAHVDGEPGCLTSRISARKRGLERGGRDSTGTRGAGQRVLRLRFRGSISQYPAGARRPSHRRTAATGGEGGEFTAVVSE